MKYIFKYNESISTHLESIPVDDNHVLQSDELETLPADFLTPAKLVNGKIVSATKEESDEAAKKYLEENGLSNNEPSSIQKQLSMMSMTMAQMQQENAALKAMIQSQNKMIANIKGGN